MKATRVMQKGERRNLIGTGDRAKKKKQAIWLSLSPKSGVHLLLQKEPLAWHLTGSGKS